MIIFILVGLGIGVVIICSVCFVYKASEIGLLIFNFLKFYCDFLRVFIFVENFKFDFVCVVFLVVVIK